MFHMNKKGSLVLRIVAGIYLIYITGQLLMSVRGGMVSGKQLPLILAAAVAFGLIGVGIIVFSAYAVYKEDIKVRQAAMEEELGNSEEEPVSYFEKKEKEELEERSREAVQRLEDMEESILESEKESLLEEEK